MEAPRLHSRLICVLLPLIALAAYANHFQNDFHFDDSHAIVDNPFIREIRNVPRFFTDTRLSSTLPDHAMYRPVVTSSLALDYWLGRGLHPFYFHLSSFLWFSLLLILIFFLFRRLMDAADPAPSNLWIAALAAACYGLHPVIAETVNYIIQRADLYCTVVVVASILWFAARPAQRRLGLYLIPAAFAILSKAPALIFPAILFVYVFLFESEAEGSARWKASLGVCLPALFFAAGLAMLSSYMTPPAFNTGAISGSLYRITQPYIAVHYFKSFFLPTELSADTDWGYVSGALSTDAVIGYAFVLGLIGLAVWTARRREMRPISFGLWWFLLALLPTAMVPLAEVLNDHRMFFPFVGLSLAVFWSLRLAFVHAGFPARRRWVQAALAAAAVLLIVEGAAAHIRNRVWHSEESLWRDVTEKSPHNGRGLMNYGLIFLNRGDFNQALGYFDKALAYTPNYFALEINLGVANAALRRDPIAEFHFRRAETLAPDSPEPYYFYGRWLGSVGRNPEAATQLEVAVRKNPLGIEARDLLMNVYAAQRNWPAVDRQAQETLLVAPKDVTARNFLNNQADRAAALPPPVFPVAQAAPPPLPPPAAVKAATTNAPPKPGSADAMLILSDAAFQAGRYSEAVLAAKRALALRPDFPEAYNNLSAAYNALHQWDEGIQNAMQAVRLRPDYQLAKNNLQWALSQKQQSQNR